MIRTALFVTLALTLLGGSGCIFEDDAKDASMDDQASAVVEGKTFARVGDVVEFTAMYSIDYPADHSYTREFLLEGSFNTKFLSGGFEVVEGEPAWTETVKSFEKRSHTLALRALRKGQYGVVVGVGADVAEGSGVGTTAGLVITVVE